MNYLNIHTDLLRSERYLGADPIERATWINLMGWCASQENGGIITDAKKWTDRKWQQVCGVTLDEVRDQSGDLYQFDSEGNLVIAHYPIDKEHEVRVNRENGKKGGRPPKKKPKQNHPVTEKKTTRREIAETEGNEKKGNEKEERLEAENHKPGTVNRIGSALSLSLPDSLPSGQGEFLDHLGQVYPNAPKSLEAVERNALADHQSILAEITLDDWEALRVWTNEASERVRGCKLWPTNRSQFLQHAGEAVEKVRIWWKLSGADFWEKRRARRKREVIEKGSPPRTEEELTEWTTPEDALAHWKKINEE